MLGLTWRSVASGCALVGLLASASGAQVRCDPGLEIDEKDPLGYRIQPEGDRCEGQYTREVGSQTLRVASFTQRFDSYSLDSGVPLKAGWRWSGTGTVHLRAQSLGPTYYRMDTQRSSGTSFEWKPAILASLGISRRNMGIVGWVDEPVGATVSPVYLPLVVTQDGEPREPTAYTLVIEPGRELAAVYVSIASVTPEGRPALFLREEEELGYGHYPEATGIEIPIPRPPAAGVYYVEIGASLEGGGPVALSLHFYHEGS